MTTMYSEKAAAIRRLELEQGYSPVARDMFTYLNPTELIWLESDKDLTDQFYTIAVMSEDDLREELEKNENLQILETVPTHSSQGEIESPPYILLHDSFAKMPDWIKTANFTSGIYALDMAEFLLACRRILLRRLRLKIWEKIIPVRREQLERRRQEEAAAKMYSGYL